MHSGKPALVNIPGRLAFEDPEIKWNVTVFENCFLMRLRKKTIIVWAFVPDTPGSREDTPLFKIGKYRDIHLSAFPACP